MSISKSSSANYKVDQKKYEENYERIFGKGGSTNSIILSSYVPIKRESDKTKYLREKTSDMDARFNENQKKLEDIGHFTRDDERKTMGRERAEERIREIHREQRQILAKQSAINRKLGRQYNDGLK